jgi:hypothetical protein
MLDKHHEVAHIVPPRELVGHLLRLVHHSWRAMMLNPIVIPTTTQTTRSPTPSAGPDERNAEPRQSDKRKCETNIEYLLKETHHLSSFLHLASK